MRVAFRAVAYAGWALAFGLSVLLAVQLHQYKFSIALGVAVLALILSAFGLVMARHCARDKDRLAMTIGIVLWAAGATTFAITEFGFWYSSYKDNYSEYVQVTKAKARQEGLKDAAWETLRTGETRANSAELEAKIKAARQNEAWTLSDKCTTATQAKSRAFCQGYFELEARLASASKLEALETRLIGEQAETKESVVHNVFAAADLLAENFNLTNRQAATIVVLIIAVMLMLARDLLLIVANSFGGAVAARTAAKTSGGMDVAPKASSPLLDRPAPRETMPRTDTLKKLTVSATEIPEPSPPRDAKPVAELPGSGGGDKGKVAGRIELATEDGKPISAKERKRRAKERQERAQQEVIAAVEQFTDECLSRDKLVRGTRGKKSKSIVSGGSKGEELRKEFRKWAKASEHWQHIVKTDDSYLGRAFNAVVDGGRNKDGSIYGAVMKKQRRAA